MKLKQDRLKWMVIALFLMAGANFVAPLYSGDTVTICHRGYTITINKALQSLHEAHGDTIGACQVTECKNR